MDDNLEIRLTSQKLFQAFGFRFPHGEVDEILTAVTCVGDEVRYRCPGTNNCTYKEGCIFQTYENNPICLYDGRVFKVED